MRLLRPALVRVDLVTPALGALLTLVAVYATVHSGVQIGVGLVAAAAVFLVALGGFLFAPHLAVAVMIPLFAILPALKVFISGFVGPLKDLVSLGAICAALLLVVLERRSRADGLTLTATALLLALYVADVGGGHGIAWAQGVRLVGEPMLLLAAGMLLDQPRRTLRFAMGSLVATACVAALYGVIQQYLGPSRLVSLGYSFSHEVRTYHGFLRSFGTFDDPFIYAAFLLFGLVAAVFWMRRGWLANVCIALLLAGLLVSLVRTAGLTTLALVALLLWRRGQGVPAVLLMGATVIAAAAILVNASGSQTRTYQTPSSIVTLNSRISAWQAALGTPSQWAFGLGVGAIGTAAQRAAFTIVPARGSPNLSANARAVDSGYFATIADVGLVGLAVFLALLGRLGFLAWSAIDHRRGAGWLAVGILVVLLLDAVTRATFTGYPTAFLGFFLVGIALAAARDGYRFEPGLGLLWRRNL